MNPNPTLLIVSAVTHGIVSRTTFAQFAIDNAEALTPAEIEQLGSELQAAGIAEHNDHLLLDITPTEAEVAKWLRAQRDSLTVTGIDQLDFTVNTYGGDEPFSATGFMPGSHHLQIASGRSVAHALAKLQEKIPSGETLARKKREEAAKLLAEAEAIAPSPSATQPAAASVAA